MPKHKRNRSKNTHIARNRLRQQDNAAFERLVAEIEERRRTAEIEDDAGEAFAEPFLQNMRLKLGLEDAE